MSNSSPYTIGKDWIARVDTVISWGLRRGLYIIVNCHHEGWLKKNPSIPDTITRFESIWTQLSKHFQNYPDRLIFEILNEPEGMPKNWVDSFNYKAYNIIRATNPTRLIIYSGDKWSNAEQLICRLIIMGRK